MMTRKERFERALQRQEVDRLPFWVKIFSPGYLSHQASEYAAMGELELADLLDLDHMANAPATVVRCDDGVRRLVTVEGGVRRLRYEPPAGTLVGTEAYDPYSQSWHPREFPVKGPEDLPAACRLFSHTRYETSEELVARAEERRAQVGDRGIVCTGMGISPLMEIIQHLAGPEQTYFLLADCPAHMDELLDTMHQDRLRFLRALLRRCPVDYIVSVENTSTTLLSPDVFRRICVPQLAEYGRLITEAGKHHILHQCGHLKAILPDIDALPALAIEAFTTPPVGNTTLLDRVQLAPHTAVIGGTNATTWLKPAHAICEEIEASLSEAGGMQGVVLTTAGVMPPAASIDKIRQVRQWAYGITPQSFP
jgi:uroporphyrinogen-III decarboxylase